MAKPKLDDPLTAEQLRSLLDYDPETGHFRWRDGINHWRAGLPAGTLATPKWRGSHIVIGLGTTSEYRYQWIGVRKKVYFAHRLAWLWFYGEWPKGEVDHINCDGTDNRIVNLREATPTQNSYNRTRRKDNKSGIKGVSWSKRSGRWLAHISHQGKAIHVGLFDTKEQAAAAYAEAAKRLHGAFARTE
jgi:hypothetical protein